MITALNSVAPADNADIHELSFLSSPPLLPEGTELPLCSPEETELPLCSSDEDDSSPLLLSDDAEPILSSPSEFGKSDSLSCGSSVSAIESDCEPSSLSDSSVLSDPDSVSDDDSWSFFIVRSVISLFSLSKCFPQIKQSLCPFTPSRSVSGGISSIHSPNECPFGITVSE